MQRIEQNVKIKVVGVGGAGGNAVQRMAEEKIEGAELLAVNTDVQALRRLKKVETLAIGQLATGGMGSGGNPEMGRKAVRESQDKVAQMLEGADLVFVAAGMGGGTGTGAAAVVAEIAKKQGALTVAVATLPFDFEGAARREAGARGLKMLGQKADTLITVDNDRLAASLDVKLSLDKAFKLADEVLRQGVQGITEVVTLPGLVNVDFADVKSVMAGGGPSFMALGQGRGKSAARDAASAAISNPLFDAPLCGASGVLFNVKGGRDLTLGQVHEVAGIIRDSTRTSTRVVFGVAQKPWWRRRVEVTLVATGVSEPADDLANTLPFELPEPAAAALAEDRFPVNGAAVGAGFPGVL